MRTSVQFESLGRTAFECVQNTDDRRQKRENGEKFYFMCASSCRPHMEPNHNHAQLKRLQSFGGKVS